MKITKTFRRVLVSLCCGVLCAIAGILFSIHAPFSAKAATIKTTNVIYCGGAGIRLDEDEKNGIRFKVRVLANEDGDVTFDNATYTKEEFLALETGILLIPSQKLSSSEELTVEGATTAYASGAKAANVTGEECVWAFVKNVEENEYYYQATAYIYNIPESYYDYDFTFRGYCNLGDENSKDYVYGLAANCSVSYVAMTAKHDGYDGEFVEELDKFLPANRVTVHSNFSNRNVYTYRVGNRNAIMLETLFAYNTGNSDVGIEITGVDCESEDGVIATLENDTIQFSGTGTATITLIEKYSRSTESLTVEVIDAINATTATSATANDVVMLNDCGFGTLEVANGYTLYGNGFTMTCGSDSAVLDFGYSFVTLDNGTLDNVQIVCPNFDYAALYKSNLTSGENRSETTDRTRYYNAMSGVMAKGNSKILNSRISGARAAVNVAGGDLLIDNSRIELGAVASIYVGAANSLTLRDVTLVQKPTASTYDSNKILMGFSVLSVCDADGNSTPITLKGNLIQNAWVNSNDKQYVPSAGESIVETVMKQTDYLHDVDGDGTNESLNLGFAYMPADTTGTVKAPEITDSRTNKDTIPYEDKEISFTVVLSKVTTHVYSYKNSNGTDASMTTESVYTPSTQSDIIVVEYNDTADGLELSKSYGVDGWIYELKVDLDKLSGYTVDFNNLTMIINGSRTTSFRVNNSSSKPSPVAVVAGSTEYKLTKTLKGKSYTATFKVLGIETSKEDPTLVAANYEAGLCVASSYGGTWSGAAPALQGIQIKYWSVAEKQYKTITLSDYTPTTAGKANGTNNTWTYSPANGDFTLTLTGGQVHSGNSVNAMPVVCDGKLYFVASNSNGLVNTGNSARSVPVSYSFKDNNGGEELTFSHTWSVAENQDAEYNYSDFCNGTLTKLEKNSGGIGCVTPDTLITLSDGSQVRVDSLTGNEQLLVWNMETGALDSAPIMFIDSDPTAVYEVIELYFSDGTKVEVISEHGFWDYDLNRYVYLDSSAADYIGHTFAKQNGDTLEKVQLVDVVIVAKQTTAWSPVTEGHLCYFVNGMLSMPGGVGGLFNIFDVDAETMQYDFAAIARDIELYGLFTYEELNAIVELPESMFNEAGGAFMKISMAKGNLTLDELIAMINRYKHFYA